VKKFRIKGISVCFGGSSLVWVSWYLHNVQLAWVGIEAGWAWLREPCSLHIRGAGLALTWMHPARVIG
jgi:hypothetical protein